MPHFIRVALVLVLLSACNDEPITCETDRDCTAHGLVCQRATGECVECLTTGDCFEEGEVCRANACELVTPCATSRQCPGLVCDTTRGYCVECVEDVDCPDAQECDADGFCHAPPPACTSDRQCTGLGLVCDRTSETCVECVRDADCPTGRRCDLTSHVCRLGVRVDGGPDAGVIDGGTDAGTVDAGSSDAGAPMLDGGMDSGVADGGMDAGKPDAGFDAGRMDAGRMDAGGMDAGPRDAGRMDAAADAANLPFDAGPLSSLLINDLGGPAGFGLNQLPPADAAQSPLVPITSGFPVGMNYYGVSRAGVVANANGYLSFAVEVGGEAFTPRVEAAGTVARIAPYWADVDTRDGGGTVWWHVDASRIVVTWDLVRYYQIGTEIDRRNTFQLVIIPRGDVAPGDFDVELRYARCEWTTGSANGGTDGLGGSPAGAGFVAGDGVNFLALPGSQTAAVLNLCTTSNVGTPGLYRYQFRFGFPL